MNNPRTFPCRNCGAVTQESFLYCTPKCQQEFSDKRHMAKLALLAAGFVQDGDARNTFSKNDVFVSIEQVMKHGLTETIAYHSAIIDQQPLRAGAGASTAGSGAQGEVVAGADRQAPVAPVPQTVQ